MILLNFDEGASLSGSVISHITYVSEIIIAIETKSHTEHEPAMLNLCNQRAHSARCLDFTSGFCLR